MADAQATLKSTKLECLGVGPRHQDYYHHPELRPIVLSRHNYEGKRALDLYSSLLIWFHWSPSWRGGYECLPHQQLQPKWNRTLRKCFGKACPDEWSGSVTCWGAGSSVNNSLKTKHWVHPVVAQPESVPGGSPQSCPIWSSLLSHPTVILNLNCQSWSLPSPTSSLSVLSLSIQIRVLLSLGAAFPIPCAQ